MCFEKTHQLKEDLSEGAKILKFNDLTAPEALKNAIENRKFEIELYWHRAAYFWIFIGLIWAALGKVLLEINILNKGFAFSGTQTFILFFITSVGLCLSFAWYLVNKGSKYWQENWELQIAYLEKTVMGPSFATNLEKTPRSKSSSPFSNPLGAASYSVSKINQLISLANLVLWLLLLVGVVLYAIYKACCCQNMELDIRGILYIAFTVFCMLTLIFIISVANSCRSHKGDKQVYYRKNEVPTEPTKES